MRLKKISAIAMVILLTSCVLNTTKPIAPDINVKNKSLSLPDVGDVAREFPTFREAKNQIEISSGLMDVDPTWILGSIINIKTGEVRGNDNYLIGTPVVTPEKEIVFKKFIDNSLALNADWLSFVKGQVSTSVKAEVSVIKSAKVTISNKNIDKKRIIEELTLIPKLERDNYALINGYVDYILSASLFKDFGASNSANGYGAKIDGAWYSKYGDTSAYHRIVAIYMPLPFAVDIIKDTKDVKNLEQETANAIKSNEIQVEQIEKPIIPPM